jgi:hypothetical protein
MQQTLLSSIVILHSDSPNLAFSIRLNSSKYVHAQFTLAPTLLLLHGGGAAASNPRNSSWSPKSDRVLWWAFVSVTHLNRDPMTSGPRATIAVSSPARSNTANGAV